MHLRYFYLNTIQWFILYILTVELKKAAVTDDLSLTLSYCTVIDSFSKSVSWVYESKSVCKLGQPGS